MTLAKGKGRGFAGRQNSVQMLGDRRVPTWWLQSERGGAPLPQTGEVGGGQRAQNPLARFVTDVCFFSQGCEKPWRVLSGRVT